MLDEQETTAVLAALAGHTLTHLPHSDAGEPPTTDAEAVAQPDLTVLRLGRRAPPALPMEVFGPAWSAWIARAAEAAACPRDYVAVPLLAAASALIGNARWAQATPGWVEPPHIWAASVGDSGSGKSPGADALMRDVLPEIERRMQGDFPDRLRDWKAAAAAHEATMERWKQDVKEATKGGNPPPLPPSTTLPPEPQAPRLQQNDVTVEKVAALLASAAPKGLLIVRDELAGWLTGMTTYNEAGRAFWVESYGGRPYRVERQKHPEPIDVPRLAVAVTGSTQPGKLAELFRDADDGLLARFCWFWPDDLPFRLNRAAADMTWAIEALDRLRVLDMAQAAEPGTTPKPIMVPLVPPAQTLLESFAREMQERQNAAGGLMRSALGKSRGTALRLSLVLEMLWWCGSTGMDAPPQAIGEAAFAAAAHLVADYLVPMAERVYGDAAARPVDRNAATLARWIIKGRLSKVHVRTLQRQVRLPGLADATTIRAACDALVEAGWLIPPAVGFGNNRAVVYAVNPKVLEAVL